MYGVVRLGSVPWVIRSLIDGVDRECVELVQGAADDPGEEAQRELLTDLAVVVGKDMPGV